MGEFEKAVAACNQALKLNPNSAIAYFTRGNAYGNLNQYERAIEDYDTAIELNPNYAAAYNNRGVAYGKLNLHERAIEDYDKAIELNPNYAEAYNNRGVAYGKLNQYERAIEDYDKAIELNPNLADAYRNRGIAHSKIGRYKESARDLKKAGILFFYSGREEDAVKGFSICFNLREESESDDVIYCGIAFFLLTSDANVMNDLRRMRIQIQDETLRIILELTLRKLQDADISEEIAAIEVKEKREEIILLLKLVKRFIRKC
jgi:tetratricopeptide (TPR) repeat protein